MGEVLQALVIDIDGEAVAVGFLQAKGGDDRNEIGVAAAFADAVQGSLHMAAARIEGGQ